MFDFSVTHLDPIGNPRGEPKNGDPIASASFYFQVTPSNLLPSKSFPLSTKLFTGLILAPKPFSFSYGALSKVLDSPAVGIRLYMAVLAQNRENMM